MSQSKVFPVFPKAPKAPVVKYAKGPYVYTEDGKKILDLTAGGTSYAILGWQHPTVNQAIIQQLDRFGHIDYKIWIDDNLEKLTDLLLKKAGHGLNRVYFAGNSGAEACEAAMKMSYQVHYDSGNKEKKWFISREQSYHGSTSDALVLGERPNLEFFRPMLSPFRSRIPMHHPLYLKRENETLDDYAKRSAKELEDEILRIGAEKVCAFVGETIMGGLVGDVPPAPNYWKYIGEICTKYNVHLILDEVYCGTGTSGKFYCCEWDEVKPDFIFIGKTLAAGYGALSAVITSDEIENIIRNGQGRLQHTTTHQGHSLAVAAALAVQKVICQDELLKNVDELGSYMRDVLSSELSSLDIFRDIRGRGLRFSIEYQTSNNEIFSQQIYENMLNKHNILVSAKWHRVSFTPSLLLSKDEADRALEAMICEIKNLL